MFCLHLQIVADPLLTRSEVRMRYCRYCLRVGCQFMVAQTPVGYRPRVVFSLSIATTRFVLSWISVTVLHSTRHLSYSKLHIFFEDNPYSSLGRKAYSFHQTLLSMLIPSQLRNSNTISFPTPETTRVISNLAQSSRMLEIRRAYLEQLLSRTGFHKSRSHQHQNF